MNCRGLGDLRKRRDVMHYVRSKNFDIVFLQDTHLTTRALPFFDTLWRGTCFHSCFSARSRGTSILFSSSLQFHFLAEKRSECGNYHIVECQINRETFLFVNVYGPNEDKPAFYEDLSALIGQFNVDFIILAGDLNFVMNPVTDSLNYVGENNTHAKKAFLELSYKYNLIDAWRQVYPNKNQYTWQRKTPFKAGRLDMFFVSDSLLNFMSNVEIVPGYRTDHNSITLSINKKQERGNGLWKFNVSHLADEAYIETIKSCVRDTVRQYAVPVYNLEVCSDYKFYESVCLTISDSCFYETLIMMLRGETVKYSKQKARSSRNLESKLIAEIIEAEEKFVMTGLQSDASNIQTLKDRLEELRRPLIEGLIVRSRVAWHEQGERNSRYFLSLEKRNFNKKCIEYITEDGKCITRIDEILDKFSNNLQKKYNICDNVLPDRSFIRSCIKDKLSHQDQLKLDADFSFLELTSALNSMRRGKTPGSNGFPVEFFRCFWQEIGPFLYRAINMSLAQSDGLRSHQEGIITLIPKKGKSPHSLKGWRPITLLNTDYKVVSTVIANRMKTVMDKIVGTAQTAYTSGRFIGENTRLLYDIIHLTIENNRPGTIMAADFEAAFESVAWSYLSLVISEMNFGPKIKQIINHLYFNTNNYSRIMLNGYLGKKINLYRGVRQGDPASGYLFNLAVSLLTEQIKKSSILNGIQVSPSSEIRISQYADDTIIFLDGSERSVSGAIMELKKFSRQSGLKINLEKTFCMPIGTSSVVQQMQHEVNFVEELTVLGIKINKNIVNIADYNLELKIPSVKKELEQWQRRNLSPIGKICIIKALLLSKLVHLFISLPNPSSQCIKNLERMLFNFVWSNKKDKVKRTKLIQPIAEGGLQMVDLDSFIKSLKLTWLKRMSTSRSDWVVLAKQALPELAILLTLSTKKLSMLSAQSTNLFYTDLINALVKFNKEHRPCDEEIITEKIWFSDWTKYETTLIRKWDDKGLRFIGDLYNTHTGCIYKKEELEARYGICMTFLCYASLVRSLPQRLQRKINPSWIKTPNIPYKLNSVLNEKKFSRHAYKTFVSKVSENNAKTNKRLEAKWIADIGNFTEGTVQKVASATTSTFLIYLHFKIVNRIYATNNYLLNINVAQSSDCTFCNDSIETIFHLFWECPKTQIFIKEILSHLRIKYGISINLDANKWFNLNEFSNIEVLIATLIKASIHKARINKSQPCLQAILQSLKLEAIKELHIARSNHKECTFEQKWGELKKIAS